MKENEINQDNTETKQSDFNENNIQNDNTNYF